VNLVLALPRCVTRYCTSWLTVLTYAPLNFVPCALQVTWPGPTASLNTKRPVAADTVTASRGLPSVRTSITPSFTPSPKAYSSVFGLVCTGDMLLHSPSSTGTSASGLVALPPILTSLTGVFRRSSLLARRRVSRSRDLHAMSIITPANTCRKSDRSQRASPTNALIGWFAQMSSSQESNAPSPL